MDNKDYIMYDLAGYPYNGKYPPKDNAKNNLYYGYESPAEECVFYDFAVMGYDLKIKYHGVYHYFMVDTDCVWLSDKNFTAQIKRFSNANEVIEKFEIEHVPLINLINELEEFEPF